MKQLLLLFKLLSFMMILTFSTSSATEIASAEVPSYGQVYRSNRIGDSYHFLLLTKNKSFYHLITNKTDHLTAKELMSSDLLNILKKRQSWGKAFPKKGKFTISNGKVYTKLLWNRVKILSSKKIKYLNKTLYLQ